MKFKISILKIVSFYKLLPSLITLVSLSLGVLSIVYSISFKFEQAAVLIIIATIMDSIDGYTARLLKATSKFGENLDSIADVISFGIAPAILMHIWLSTYTIAQDATVFLLCTILFPSCTAVRLARFNTQSISLEDVETYCTESQYTHDKDVRIRKILFGMGAFFCGIPAPVGAMLLVLPLMLKFSVMKTLQIPAEIILIYQVLISLSLVSTLPTFSLKYMKIPVAYIPIALLGSALYIAYVLTVPWNAIPLLLTIYICSIPFSVIKFEKICKNHTGTREYLREKYCKKQ
ncbi:CDP-diacylglycerol--glycerol-3-phosphate 3-phosphatidyltransferase [Candidatus Fokinia solitaria]|uniref:CDP-diacylglycerol--glycerol-3-phosphate 3-phosphatidyltransferase n=1 Tax=Candidatus Fokinia solitaria TaxID=1802984 RepID=A0A2U8BRI2_9RICK|nr:phosphatidylcholine/phosphatidylserine synthase [Candidatus Fokinia solitaria]AWD32938.1 CDP-diacylglycerol--glycerol-3-phosphate 3-phosphatidyltransferase [Candidatus Fokinia solitaria]